MENKKLKGVFYETLVVGSILWSYGICPYYVGTFEDCFGNTKKNPDMIKIEYSAGPQRNHFISGLTATATATMLTDN